MKCTYDNTYLTSYYFFTFLRKLKFLAFDSNIPQFWFPDNASVWPHWNKVLSAADWTWSKNNVSACSLDKRTGGDSWGREPGTCNKTCIFPLGDCAQCSRLYCHCWFAPVIPDGTAEPGAAVPSLLWKPWSYLTPLCRQVPCHPAKPHWLPVQKGPPVLMQMGRGVRGAVRKAFPSPQPLFYSFPFFTTPPPPPLSCSRRLRFTI